MPVTRRGPQTENTLSASDRHPGPVQLGRIATAVGERGVEERLRQIAATELQNLDLSQASNSYTLDVRLDVLSTSHQGARTEVTCRVSATLRDAEDGALRAILRGGARTDSSPPKARRARAAALAGAVRSTLSRIPDAIR